MSNGMRAQRGFANREYMYRADRTSVPAASGWALAAANFELDHMGGGICRNRTPYPADQGAVRRRAVVFYSRHAKWYRSLLQWLANDFGSPNFGTESSTCHMATVGAWKDLTGNFGE